MPELLWKAYIDFEFDDEEWEKTRELYERLLRKTSHVKVWVSYAQVCVLVCFLYWLALTRCTQFEANAGRSMAADLEPDEEDENPEPADPEVQAQLIDAGMEKARGVFERGYKDLKNRELKEEVRCRLLLSACQY